MSDLSSTSPTRSELRKLLPDLPLVIWMVLLTLSFGLFAGWDANDLIREFNLGFGRSLGEFALILLPSFTLAAALAARDVASEAAGRTAALASPIAGAGMICPDTAYAALSPAAGRYKLDAAFGAYAGFKLLYPAGPLIVAAGLGATGTVGAEPSSLLLVGLLLTLPVWAAGVLWRHMVDRGETTLVDPRSDGSTDQLLLTFAPFMVMAVLLITGGAIGNTNLGFMDFFLAPKGALIFAAILALLQTPSEKRRECLDSAVRRTGSLLLLIGAASALGSLLTGVFALDRVVPTGSGSLLTLIALFALTAVFKLVQGSSMATFAAIAPVAAPIVMTSGANEIAAVFAICLGSFVTILPNDSYYWLVRRDVMQNESGEGRALIVLSCGAILQALVGMMFLLAAVTIWT